MGVCIVVPAKRGVSGHGKAGAQNENAGKKMVVLPITRSEAQIRFREGGGKVEGSREWV